MTQLGHGVAHRGQADAQHDRILRTIDELVDCACVVAAGTVDADVPVVEVLPGVHRSSRVTCVLAHGERGLGPVPGLGRVRQRSCGGAVQVVEDELLARQSCDRRPIAVHGNGEVSRETGVTRCDERLPRDPHDRVALPHEPARAGMLGEVGVVQARCAVDSPAREPLVAAIGYVQDQGPIAARQVHRLEDLDVRPVFDVAARVARG